MVLCALYIFTHHSLTFSLRALSLWRTYTPADKRKMKSRLHNLKRCFEAECEIAARLLSAPLCSSPAGKIRALSLKALYLCSLCGSSLSLNRFEVTFKSQLLQALTVNGQPAVWKINPDGVHVCREGRYEQITFSNFLLCTEMHLFIVTSFYSEQHTYVLYKS